MRFKRLVKSRVLAPPNHDLTLYAPIFPPDILSRSPIARRRYSATSKSLDKAASKKSVAFRSDSCPKSPKNSAVECSTLRTVLTVREPPASKELGFGASIVPRFLPSSKRFKIRRNLFHKSSEIGKISQIVFSRDKTTTFNASKHNQDINQGQC